MSKKDDDPELDAWRGEWQALGADDLAAELVARATRDGKRMRRTAIREVVAVTFSTAACLWLLVHTHGSVEVVVIVSMILLFNGAWLTHYFTVRANLFATSGEGVAAFVDLTRKRLGTELRWLHAARRWTIAITAVTVPWCGWVFVAHRDAYFAAPWRAVVGFGTVTAILTGLFVFYRWKEGRLRREAASFERQLVETA